MSIGNLTKEKRSELDVSLFFGEFFKLPMSQKRPSYESSRFARSSNKWFRHNFFRDKKQKDNQSKHCYSRNKWLKIQVFPMKSKGTSITKRCFYHLARFALSGIRVYGYTYWLHSWMRLIASLNDHERHNGNSFICKKKKYWCGVQHVGNLSKRSTSIVSLYIVVRLATRLSNKDPKAPGQLEL